MSGPAAGSGPAPPAAWPQHAPAAVQPALDLRCSRQPDSEQGAPGVRAGWSVPPQGPSIPPPSHGSDSRVVTVARCARHVTRDASACVKHATVGAFPCTQERQTSDWGWYARARKWRKVTVKNRRANQLHEARVRCTKSLSIMCERSIPHSGQLICFESLGADSCWSASSDARGSCRPEEPECSRAYERL